MKQRIAVRAIVRKDNTTLLLKRAAGHESLIGKYELPGGRLEGDEQPEDAIVRHLQDDAGLSVQVAQLYDVLTYIEKGEREVQYALIVYLVSLAAGGDRPALSNKYNKYDWVPYIDTAKMDLTEATELLLGIAENSEVKITTANLTDGKSSKDVKNTSNSFKLIVYTDGGSRGNPGPSASGFVIMDDQEQVLASGGQYLGITTNNQAEYHGVRLGLEKALELGGRVVDFRIDSLLVVNQMNGIYKIKNRELWPIHERIKELIARFDRVTFTHVRREFNKLADGMVNRTLDEHIKTDTL